MPLQLIHTTPTQVLALWRITEKEEVLSSLLETKEQIPAALIHPHKRTEFLASRVLTQTLLKQFNQTYAGIYKNEFGKPFLTNSSIHISQSHSYPYVAVLLDSEKNVGIDLEQKKSKLQRIAPRVFNDRELANAGDDLTKLCILWCAKETLIKLYGKKDLILKEEIAIDPFILSTAGLLGTRIANRHGASFYTLQYLVEEDFVLVFNP